MCKSLLPAPAIYIRSKLVYTHALILHFSFARSSIPSHFVTIAPPAQRETITLRPKVQSAMYRVSFSSCSPISNHAITNP